MKASITSLRAKIAVLEQLTSLFTAPSYVRAVTVLERADTVILTGMGKSGIAAQKIAATLRSTGKPAHYLDPAAAVHGDLGMIRPGDVVIALSNSGNSVELMPVMAHCESLDVPTVAITARIQSPLAQAASIVLRLPQVGEGDPIRMAPMASITAQIAVGDALACELMVSAGFTVDQFRACHPGGALGQMEAAE